MSTAPGRLLMFDREAHLDAYRPLEVGDQVPVYRGNGPREGDWMGTATVTAVGPAGPELDVQLGPPAV